MALHESMLEEFGLGPVWVRRREWGGPAGDTAEMRLGQPAARRMKRA